MLGDRLRILVAEDNWFIAQDLAETLTAMGHTVIGPVATLVQAECLATDGIDGALLDTHLGDSVTTSLALQLARRGKRVLVISGTRPPRELADLAELQKPFGLRDLQAALVAVFGPARA